MAQALLKQNAARARRHRWETTNLALYLSGSIMYPIWQLPYYYHKWCCLQLYTTLLLLQTDPHS